MLPLLLPDWLQGGSLKNPYNVASVPDPLIVLTIYHAVLQCSTFKTVSVTMQIFLQSLMVGTASCCKNDGTEACWLVFSLSFFCHLDSPIDAPAWSPFPLIPRIEGFSAGQSPMSMVSALLSHSIPQTTTTRPGLSAIANPGSHNLQI